MSDPITPAPEAPAAEVVTPPAGDPTPEAPTPTPEAPPVAPPEVDEATQKLIDDAAKAASREANREAAELRKRAKAAEEELQKRKDAELSDAERLQKERDDAVAKATKAEADARATVVNAALERAARAAGFADESDALSLATQIEIDDEGQPLAVVEAVKALAEAKPHYLAGPGTPRLDPNNPGHQPAPVLTPQQQTQQLHASKHRGGIWSKPPAPS